MDISVIKDSSIKIKGKKTTFIVDPFEKMPKTSGDAIIFLNSGCSSGIEKVTDSRLIINGPGDYEIGGAKVSGLKTPQGTLYRITMDGLSTILGTATEAEIEGFNVGQIAIINTDNNFSENFVTAAEPRVTILYGSKKDESAKILGAENASSVPKITITKDKLPEEMQIATLG